jgi:DNA-3-methyladenine glycosylase
MSRLIAGNPVDVPETGLTKLPRSFFEQPGIEVARGLVGTIMVRRIGDELRRARIVETEAYLGPGDLASHSSKGRTARTEVMFGPAGHAYVYFIYGMHQMFNVVAGVTGEAHAVLVRAAQPLDDWIIDLTGPGRLARGFGITRADNGLDLTDDDIFFLSDPAHRPRIVRSKRIGIDYARHWKERLLRFVDVRNPVAGKLKRC